MLITLLCGLGLRGLDALNARRADALASRVKVLQDLPVTAGVPQIVLEQLASAAQFCPLPSGVDVVVQGAPAHAFYAVAEGRVVVHRDGQAVVHLGPGDSFGERGLLDHAPPERHRHHGDGHDVAPPGRQRAARCPRGGAGPPARARPEQHRARSAGPAGRDGGGGRSTLGADVTVGEREDERRGSFHGEAVVGLRVIRSPSRAASCQAGGPVLPVPGGTDHPPSACRTRGAAVSYLADRTAVSLLTPDRRTGLAMSWSGRDMQRPGQRMTGPHFRIQRKWWSRAQARTRGRRGHGDPRSGPHRRR